MHTHAHTRKILSITSALVFSLSLSPSLSFFLSRFSLFHSLYLPFALSFVRSLIHRVILTLLHSLLLSLSRFSMIQRSSRGSNLVPRRIQKRLARQFSRCYTHFTKSRRVSWRCDVLGRERLHSRRIVATSRRNGRHHRRRRFRDIEWARDSTFVSQWRSDWASRRRGDVYNNINNDNNTRNRRASRCARRRRGARPIAWNPLKTII